MKDITFRLASTLLSILLLPLILLLALVSKAIGNLLPSTIIALIFWIFLSINFYNALIAVLATFVLISFIQDHKLFHETFINQTDSIYSNFKFFSLIKKYKKRNEKHRFSPSILIESKKYHVIEFGTYGFDPRNIKTLTGFIIIDVDGNIIDNRNLCNELVNLYLFWRKVYFTPILGKNIRENRKFLIKNWIKFQEKFKYAIEERIGDNYSKISSVKEKEYIEILKELDKEVLDQYSYVTNKLKLSLEIFDQLYDIFLMPSKELYSNIFSKIDTISTMGEEENKIWSKRLQTWEKLAKFYSHKIDAMPKPSFKFPILGFLGDLINFFILRQQEYPIGGGTIVGLSVEGSKTVKRGVYKYANEIFIRHKFGIDAIKTQIKLNGNLKDIRDEYRSILSSNNVPLIRNF